MENKEKSDIGLIHNIDKPSVTTALSTPIVVGIILAALVLGTATGFGITKFSSMSSNTGDSMSKDETAADGSKTSAGVLDKKTFPDEAEGLLKEGGFEGEGSFHLERPGGEDQTAYLTSTAVDLSEFIGKKVQVWGKTYEAEKAGWLMDVGYVEVVK